MSRKRKDVSHPAEPRGPSRAGATLDCWVVTDGKAGTENQCIGLAEALGLVPTVKRIRPRRLWRRLPVGLWARLLGAAPQRSLQPEGDALAPPWPDLLIASGRSSVAYALTIRRLAAGRCFVVQVQDPRVDPALFDLVVPPRHDGVSGSNVLATTGALNRVTPDRLAAAAARWAPALADLPRPLVAVLVGGASRTHRFTAATAARLGRDLARLCDAHGAGLAITLSRRTPAACAAALRDALAGRPVWLWDGSGDNPYFGLLALADAVVVTADSVSMTSEACTAGKPVYVAAVDGGSAKFRAFHADFVARGHTRPFAGVLDFPGGPRLDETGRVAAEVAGRLDRRG